MTSIEPILSGVTCRRILLIVISLCWASLAVARTVEKERDDIFMLTAYSLALTQWDERYGEGMSCKREKEGRGANVAAIAVSNNNIVSYGLNRVSEKQNSVYHAEMDMVLHNPGREKQPGVPSSLRGRTVYTTLEPCLMCFGTMHVLHAKRIVYGQPYSKLPASSYLQRRHDISLTPMEPTRLPYLDRLEQAFRESKKEKNCLWNQLMKRIYQDAYCHLVHLKPRNEENEAALKNAKLFLSKQLTGRPAPQCK